MNAILLAVAVGTLPITTPNRNAAAVVPDPVTRRPARYTGTHRRRRSTEPVWEGIAPDGRRADDDTLTPEAVAYLAALHRDLPAEPEPVESVPPAVPDTDEWWRHRFAAARIRDRLAFARVGITLPDDFRALVDAARPVVEAKRREVEHEFRALVDSLSGEHPVLTPAGTR